MSPGVARTALHVAVALFGFAALFGKWIALPASAIVLGRTVVGAAAIAAVLAARRQPIGRPDAALAGSGAILAVHWVAFFAAVQVSTVAIALIGYASFPLFVLAFERGRGGVSAVETIAAAAAVAGLVLLIPNFAWTDAAARGLALGLLSALAFAWLTIRNRAKVASANAARIALWQNACAAACLVPFVAFRPPWATPAAFDVVLVLVLGVVCTGLAHTLFIASMQRASARAASVVAALEPVYGIALAAALLGEIPSARTLAGGALIVAAAVVASRRIA